MGERRGKHLELVTERLSPEPVYISWCSVFTVMAVAVGGLIPLYPRYVFGRDLSPSKIRNASDPPFFVAGVSTEGALDESQFEEYVGDIF